jgi:hypothetical protein
MPSGIDGKVIKMKRTIITSVALALLLSLAAFSARAGIVAYDRDANYAQYIRFDRYLDVEIWTDDDTYYEGENISISFRADRNCYVAIYNIDSRGRVNLIFPLDPNDDPWVEGNRIYHIPDNYDDYDLTVSGPAGVEYLQIIASREPFAIPDWYAGSGIVCDDDPYDFMDYVNATYFSCDYDCPRAFDLTSFRIKEWNNYYFRPVYVHHVHHHDYWDWGYYGSMYIDYPFGATVYIDGVYWGIAPLFIPRVYFGWHYVTIYDRYGYCWEDRIHIIKRKAIVVDDVIVKTRAGVKSRFKEVRVKGYISPAQNGYPDYDKQVRIKKTHKPVASVSVDGKYKIAREKMTGGTIEKRFDDIKKRTEERRQTYKAAKRSTSTTARERSTGLEKRSTKKRDVGRSGTRSTYDKRKSTGTSKSSGSYKTRKSSPGRSTSVDKKSSSTTRKSGSGAVKRSSGKTTSSGSKEKQKSTNSSRKTDRRGR